MAEGKIKRAYDLVVKRASLKKASQPKSLQLRAIEMVREGQLSKAARVLEDNLLRVDPSKEQGHLPDPRSSPGWFGQSSAD